MSLFVESPVDRMAHDAGRVLLDVRRCLELIANEAAQMIGIIGGVGDDVSNSAQALNEAARLRTITPLARRDGEADRQAKSVDRDMDLGRQASLGASDTGSFKPPFCEVASACVLQIVASTRTYSKSGSWRNALKRLSHIPAKVHRRNRE